MSKVLHERGFGSLPSSTEANLRDQLKSISTTIEADSYPIRRIGSSQYTVSTGHNPYSEASHINNSIPRKEKDPGSFTLPCFINNVCFDNALVDLGASVSVMPLSIYLNLGLGELAHTKLTVELADRTVKYPKGIAENILVGIGKFVFPVDFIILDMPEDIKVPLIFRRPFLSIARAKIDVYKRNITLKFERKNGIDLEARLMGETLVINRSLDPYFEDYIELNDLNEAFKLRRNQGDDLMPTIEEGCEDGRMAHMRDTLACMRWNGEGEAGESCQYGVFMHMIRHSHLSIWRIHAHDTAYSPDWPVFRYFLQVSQYGDLVKEMKISTNIGGEFTNLEILKCWSLETSRRSVEYQYAVQSLTEYAVLFGK
ncbi:hypothetical protein Tco_0905710 [Tanacetum coccineum]